MPADFALSGVRGLAFAVDAKVYIIASPGCSPAPIVAPIGAAVMATLIMTARLNDVDPQAWLADGLARINDHAIHRLDELLGLELAKAYAKLCRGGVSQEDT
jgi:hypothetical protein